MLHARQADDAERAFLRAALEFHGGNMTATAAGCVLERSHFCKKMRVHGIR